MRNLIAASVLTLMMCAGPALSQVVGTSGVFASSGIKAEVYPGGAADDVRIQAAIRALGGSGGTIRLGHGSYVLSTTVKIPSHTSLLFEAGSTVTVPRGHALEKISTTGPDYAGHYVCAAFANEHAGGRSFAKEIADNAGYVKVYGDADIHVEGCTIVFEDGTTTEIGLGSTFSGGTHPNHTTFTVAADLTSVLAPGDNITVWTDSTSDKSLTYKRVIQTITYSAPNTEIVMTASIGVTDGYTYQLTYGDVTTQSGYISNCSWAGVYLDKCRDSTIRDVSVEDVGQFCDWSTGGRGYGLLISDCLNVTASRCKSTYAGYEDFGIRGTCTECAVTDSYGYGARQHLAQIAGHSVIGKGSCTKCKLARLTGNGAITIHGEDATSSLQSQCVIENCSIGTGKLRPTSNCQRCVWQGNMATGIQASALNNNDALSDQLFVGNVISGPPAVEFATGGTGTIKRITLQGNMLDGIGTNVIYVSAGTATSGLQIVGNTMLCASTIFKGTLADVVMTGNRIMSGYYGWSDGTFTNWLVQNNVYERSISGAFGSYPASGITILLHSTATMSGCRFSNNGWVIADATKIGTGTITGGDCEIVRASGIATIASGNSDVTVTHGLGITPTDIQITAMGAVTTPYVDSVGATTFKIQAGGAVGTDTSVSWTARYVKR